MDTTKLHQVLAQGADALKLSVSDTQATQLVGFVERIHKWNKAYNLTSIRDPEQMMVKHILDSIAVTPHVGGKRVIDVGTGPGLPGVPLAIMLPDTQFTLLDSLGKRVRFMKQCAYELGLQNVSPLHSRVEAHQPGQPYDVVLSRAFASLKDMLHWCQHLVDSSGVFLALKGQFPQSEIDEVSDHFQIESVTELSVPDLEGDRHLVTIRKV
ncbi:16S rRNA (guanine(527)-N(7))-methyltransferase RsmG [Aestuariibacter sp. A3R04]|uniref:16S rRNA (guanine(527)-N(7))-methyltransferase RsmG n=1 Tax=Aestuariibacter sp. A3R04 TaxID=2841571 RepID=UPI001C0A5A8C|nr:16S rRNA (guanine(527)-N(7))-methyltransferase RsmG [Aestuariibacter sp. A3R04]